MSLRPAAAAACPVAATASRLDYVLAIGEQRREASQTGVNVNERAYLRDKYNHKPPYPDLEWHKRPDSDALRREAQAKSKSGAIPAPPCAADRGIQKDAKSKARQQRRLGGVHRPGETSAPDPAPAPAPAPEPPPAPRSAPKNFYVIAIGGDDFRTYRKAITPTTAMGLMKRNLFPEWRQAVTLQQFQRYAELKRMGWEEADDTSCAPHVFLNRSCVFDESDSAFYEEEEGAIVVRKEFGRAGEFADFALAGANEAFAQLTRGRDPERNAPYNDNWGYPDIVVEHELWTMLHPFIKRDFLAQTRAVNIHIVINTFMYIRDHVKASDVDDRRKVDAYYRGEGFR